MTHCSHRVRVLYSFPHKLGADRICYTAWQQVNGLAAAGADVLVCCGALLRAVPVDVRVDPTLSIGPLRIPPKLLGSNRAFALHDYIVSKRLEAMQGQVDIVHTWPLGAALTLKTAARLDIPTVLERPNAHTQFAMDAVRLECERVGVVLPANHEHSHNSAKLRIEEEEYRLADRLLCPSDFVVGTFLEKGFPRDKLQRTQYGFDPLVCHPNGRTRNVGRGCTMMFAGGCAPRKGLHYALHAWLASPAHIDGTFLIAGAFVPGYAEKLNDMLRHSSVRVLGHRKDVPDLMRTADMLVLPTVEEGSALVTYEARGCGCVLLVSDAAGAVCTHMEDALVHHVGDVETLTQHITLLHRNRSLLERLRAGSLSTASQLTWSMAGVKLLQAYRDTIAARSPALAIRTD